ncbi:MAG TPA: hypothetical protein VK171_15755 [Fimbriimonas sp.]|nr:hypothetical protein [Fimbriimonas sp.]
MRRFIATLPGKVISNVVALSLVLPYMAMGLASKGHAQLRSLPGWAVVNFANKKAPSATDLGAHAAASLGQSLHRTGKYNVESQDNVQRVVDGLGLRQPLPDLQNVLRVANELRVQTIVTGDVAEYRIDRSASGKQARASMRVVCYDVASGLPVNGAAIAASSIVQGSEVADEVLIKDAIAQAAGLAAAQISQQTLPLGTVLNTQTSEVLINSGTRSGFKQGMKVIISRGRQQVGEGTVTEVLPDKATVKINRSDLGIQPGDKVRAIFDVPVFAPAISPTGETIIQRPKAQANTSSLISTMLVMGIVAFLVLGSGGRGGEVISPPVAEAYVDPTLGSTVKITWKPNGYAKGNSQRRLWQVFRNDDPTLVSLTTPGSSYQVLDTPTARTTTWTNLPNSDFNVCNDDNQVTSNATGAILGRPYQYQVQLVFVIPSSDLPGGSSGGTGTTATTGNTGGTAGNNGTNGNTGTATDECFFVSALSPTGLATPLARAGLVGPANNGTMATPQVFTFNSVVNPAFDITVEYQLQVSSSLNFTAATTYKKVLFTRRDTGTLASDPIDLTNDTAVPASVRSAAKLYWRIGARNIMDSPGPARDVLSQDRYVFSPANQLTRPGVPPPPPSN